MSKRRAVVLSATAEKLSQADTARLYGVSESFVSRLMARWRAEGDAAFEPRSRRPRNSLTATDPATVTLIVNVRVQLTGNGLDAGPATIAWHLEQHHGATVSIATIRRYLIAAA